MGMIEPELLIEIFRQQAARHHEMEMATANDRLDDERKRHQQRERREKEEHERFEQLVEATAAQVAAFRETLDSYDTATVRALMDNQKALDVVRERREAMEAAAYRLPDERMVFKTEDGKRVFDRDGAQLSHNVVHPDAVPDSAPRWEAMKQTREAEGKLEVERDALHAYQQRLDEAREAADKGHVSADALAKMDADLRKAMPDAVKAQLPDAAAGRNVPNTPAAIISPAQRLPRVGAIVPGQ